MTEQGGIDAAQMVEMRTKVPEDLARRIWQIAVERTNSERRSTPLAVFVEELMRDALVEAFGPAELSMVEVTVEDHEADHKNSIIKALNDLTAQCFPWSWKERPDDALRAATFDVPGMYEPQGFARALAEAAWKANDGYCRVETRFCFVDEDLETETYAIEPDCDLALIENEPWRRIRLEEPDGESPWEFPAGAAQAETAPGEAAPGQATYSPTA